VAEAPIGVAVGGYSVAHRLSGSTREEPFVPAPLEHPARSRQEPGCGVKVWSLHDLYSTITDPRRLERIGHLRATLTR
jgi:hypothetical protein